MHIQWPPDSQEGVTETTIIGVPAQVASGIRSGNDGNRVSFPSFLPTCLRMPLQLFVRLPACKIDRRLMPAGRAKELQCVIILFITQGIFIVRATAGSE